jgi:hypothetical protein
MSDFIGGFERKRISHLRFMNETLNIRQFYQDLIRSIEFTRISTKLETRKYHNLISYLETFAVTQIWQLVIIIQAERSEILTQIRQSMKTSWYILEGSHLRHSYESCQNNRIGTKPFIIRVCYYRNCNSFIHWIFKSKCASTLLLFMASFNFNQFRKAHNKKCYLFIFRLFQLDSIVYLIIESNDSWIQTNLLRQNVTT